VSHFSRNRNLVWALCK